MDRTSNAIAVRTTRRAVDAWLWRSRTTVASRACGRRRPSRRARDDRASRSVRDVIAAVREELEQFAASHLRLHLAIAEGDRYVLTSIEVECEGSDEHRELLRRFMSEFKPEQIKHYLAREVIAGLRNASAIDLSQFAGLNAAQRRTS